MLPTGDVSETKQQGGTSKFAVLFTIGTHGGVFMSFSICVCTGGWRAFLSALGSERRADMRTDLRGKLGRMVLDGRSVSGQIDAPLETAPKGFELQRVHA